jgi:hypothetical protein
MKKEIGTAPLVIALLTVLCILGAVAWRLFAPEPVPNSPEIKKAGELLGQAMVQQAQQQLKQRQPGQ